MLSCGAVGELEIIVFFFFLEVALLLLLESVWIVFVCVLLNTVHCHLESVSFSFSSICLLAVQANDRPNDSHPEL